MTSFEIQRQRAVFYGKWLLLAFVLAVVTGRMLGASLGFFGWAVLCGVAASRRDMLAWAALCLIPLAILSLLWIEGAGSPDPFGLRWANIAFFAGACMVTAATGILTLFNDAGDARIQPGPNR